MPYGYWTVINIFIKETTRTNISCELVYALYCVIKRGKKQSKMKQQNKKQQTEPKKSQNISIKFMSVQ